MYSLEETQHLILNTRGEKVYENKIYSGIAMCGIAADTVI